MSLVREIAINVGVGLAMLGAILTALFLFGCVMCFCSDKSGDAPWWMKAIGAATLLILTAAVMGRMARA